MRRMIEWSALSDYIRQRAQEAGTANVDFGTVLDVLEWIADAPMEDADAPRVLAVDELVSHDGAVWVEYNPDKVALWSEWMFVDYIADYRTPRTVMLLRRHGGQMAYKETGYGVTWRCWTARPTNEQMEETPWTK